MFRQGRQSTPRRRLSPASLLPVAVLAVLLAGAAPARVANAAPPVVPPVDSWLYQLQDLDPAKVADSGYELLVTDYSATGEEDGEWSPAEVALMKSGGRTVLAYLSIGEAEDYRWYWDPAWEDDPPDWLGPENPRWKGNWRVRYWDPEWQSIVLDYLDRILAQGFDGVWLDIVDAYEFWGPDGKNEIPDAADRMVAFVRRIAAHARAENPDFLVVPQNAPGLVERAGYLDVVSGIGAEDTWYRGNRRQHRQQTREAVGFLDRFRNAGRRVLVVDYPRARKKVDGFYERAEARGYVPFAARRDLDRLTTWRRHPAPPIAPVSLRAPAAGAALDPGAAPEFSWSPLSGSRGYRVSFSGDPAFRKVITWPRGRKKVLRDATFTPTRKQWKKIRRQARRNDEGVVWWWVTRIDDDGHRRTCRAGWFRLAGEAGR